MTVDGVVNQDVRENQQTDIHKYLLGEFRPEILTREVMQDEVLNQTDNCIDDHSHAYPLGEFPVAEDVLQEIHCNGAGKGPDECNYSFQCHMLRILLQRYEATV